MGNAPSGAEIEQCLQSADPQRILHGLRQLTKVIEGRGKDGIDWSITLSSLSQLLASRTLHTRDLLSSPEMFQCLSGLVRLPRLCVVEPAFQAVLQRNLLINLMNALASNLGQQVNGALLGCLIQMLGDQPDASLEEMANEDADIPARGLGTSFAKKLGRKLQEKKYSAQHCGIFPKAWKRLLLQVILMEKVILGMGNAPNSVSHHPLAGLLREVKEFERHSISFAVFLFYHYLATCRFGDVLLNLLMELSDFLQSNVAKIATLLSSMETTADEVIWCGTRRIVLLRPEWLHTLGDQLRELIVANQQSTDEERRMVASASYGCFQVYAQVYRHSEKVIELVEMAANPFADLSTLVDLPSNSQDLQLSLNCLHTHILHARLSDGHLVRTLNVLCIVLYRLSPYLLHHQQTLPPFLASVAQACIRCFQALIDQPALTADMNCRMLLLRLLALCHARFRQEMEQPIFECIAAISGVWSTTDATCIVPFVLEACLQLLSFAALFWAEMRATHSSAETIAALHALATDLCIVPWALPPATRSLVRDPGSILMSTNVLISGCHALLELLDTCSTQTSERCLRPPPSQLQIPDDFEPPRAESDLLHKMDFVYFTWGASSHCCSIAHLCTIDNASRCHLELPSSILSNPDHHAGLVDTLGQHLHAAVQVFVEKIQRLLYLLHTETPIAAEAMTRFVQFFGPLHASHLMCFVQASILLGGAWNVGGHPPIPAPAPPLVAPAPESNPSPTHLRVNSGTMTQQQQLVQQLREENQLLCTENHRLREKQEAAGRLEALAEAVNCPICLENFMQREPCALHCGHIFCYACVAPLLNGVCPLCRTPLTNTPVIKLKSFNID